MSRRTVPRGPNLHGIELLSRMLLAGLAVGIGAAAGALNVTRRGLGSGSREDIERMARRVVLTPLDGG